MSGLCRSAAQYTSSRQHDTTTSLSRYKMRRTCPHIHIHIHKHTVRAARGTVQAPHHTARPGDTRRPTSRWGGTGSGGGPGGGERSLPWERATRGRSGPCPHRSAISSGSSSWPPPAAKQSRCRRGARTAAGGTWRRASTHRSLPRPVAGKKGVKVQAQPAATRQLLH